ncbi:MAG: zinc ribbon domain-containing protein [Promethearchaeota archaeon]
MGIGRVIGSGCVGMLCLIPMAWLSFSFLDLTGSITGGLIEDLGAALGSLGDIPMLGGFGTLIGIVGGMVLGLALIFLFPIHWCLFYRPDDVMLLISVILPWILCCTITSALFAHSPRGGIHTSLAIGIGYMIPALLIYFLIPVIVDAFSGGMGLGSLIAGIFDGLASGLTDLPYALAVFTAILEGSLVGAVFGGFIGSLKYKPAGAAAKPKKSKVKGEVMREPTLASSESESIAKTDFCTNCGAKLVPGDDFCTNCGAKLK